MGKKLTGVRIKERDLEELERLAKDDDETVSFLIRQAIPEFLDRRRKATKCKYRFYPTPEQEQHLARVSETLYSKGFFLSGNQIAVPGQFSL